MSAAAPPAPAPWLFGPKSDVFFGYGAAYLISVPLLVLLSLQGLGTPAQWVTPALALLVSIPHYGATILRVYERSEDRRRYAVFAVWISLLLLALFMASFWVAVLGSLLVTVYVTWSPWHFAGQNFGLFLMYLRRAGHDPAAIKRPLYVSFILSALIAMLGMHAVNATGDFAPQAYDPSQTFTVLRAGIPNSIAFAVAVAAAASWLVCMGLVWSRLRGRVPLRETGPLAVLVGMQALWYLPSAAAVTGLFEPTQAGFAFTAIWIAVAHAIQYLWVTFYYAKREQRARSLGVFYGKAMLAGAVILTPMLFLAPGFLGARIPSAAGVGVLTIALLNIHHFVLDGAIWKLRDGRVARILLRQEAPPESAPIEPGRWRVRPVAALVWGLAAVSLLAQVELVRLVFSATRSSVEAVALEKTAAGLAWFGGDTPSLWARVGQEFERAGQPARALPAYQNALRFSDAPPAWLANRVAWLLLGEADSNDEALKLAQYLVRVLGNTRPEGYQTLAAVHASAGRWRLASAAATSALRVAEAQGDGERAALLRSQIQGYRTQRLDEPQEVGRIDPAPAAGERVTY